jgi:hypothetical protein
MAARFVRSLLPLWMLVGWACGTPDAPQNEPPEAELTVALEAHARPAVIAADEELAQTIACDVTFRATAVGSGFATWEDGTFYWYAGLDRSVPMDSFALPASQARQAWSGEDISAGGSREAHWQISAYAPFGLRFTQRYHVASTGTAAATAAFTCGPDIPAAPPSPEISELSVQAPAGPLEPGDTLSVHYTATSALGLWETRVVLSGPCDVTDEFGEALAKTVSRTVRLPIPATCALGVPITVGIGASDAALQERSRLNTSALALTDVTPPQIRIYSFPASGWGSLTSGVRGVYFTPDTIEVMVEATDNNVVRTILWEVRPVGFRDSLLTNESSAGGWIDIPLSTAWSGPIEIRFSARDAVGLVSDTVASDPGGLRVLPTIERPAVSKTIPGTVVADVALDAVRGALYVIQAGPSQVTVLETATLSTSETIPTPARPSDIDLTAGGDSLVLTLTSLDALGVVDLRAASRQVTVLPLTALDTTLDQHPVFARAMANGKVLVRLGGSNPAGLTLLEVDLTNGTQTIRTDAGDGGRVGEATLERSHDHTVLMMHGGPSEFQRYQTSTNGFGTRESVTPYYARPSLDGNGGVLALGLDLYDGSLQFVRALESMVPGFIPSALAPSGEYAYQSLQPWGILRSRVSDGAIVDRTPSPVDATFARVSDDGAFLVQVYVGSPSVIRVVDLR